MSTAIQSTATATPVELPALSARPLVSVLIANYNYARYLPDALDSLLAQSYREWEAIVCDDGSTDGSSEVLKKYAERDRRIRYVLKDNGGMASALNASFREARGHIVCVLDADDIYERDKIEKTVELAKANPSCGLLTHRLQIIGADNRPSGGPIPFTLESGWIAPDLLQTGRVVKAAWGSAISLRREVAELIFPIGEWIRAAVDAYLILAAATLTRVAPRPEALVRYRVHGNNNTLGSITDFGSKRKLDCYYSVFKAHGAFAERMLGRPVLRPEEYEQFRTFLLYFFAATGEFPEEYYRGTAAELIGRIASLRQRTFWRILLKLPRRAATAVLYLKVSYYPGKSLLRPFRKGLGEK